MSFPCTGCGACCRRVNQAVEATRGIEAFAFPYTWDETGKCEMLGDDDRCKSYDDRPFLCKVDEVGASAGIPLQQWYRMNAEGCNSMMDEAKIDRRFRIDINIRFEA